MKPWFPLLTILQGNPACISSATVKVVFGLLFYPMQSPL